MNAKAPSWWWGLVVISFGIRLFLSLVTFGTNDVDSWQLFQRTLLSEGWLGVYRKIDYFNHPPLMEVYLWAISYFTVPYPKAFPFLMRLPAMLADGLSVWLVFQLVKKYWDEASAWRASAWVAAGPLLILVSGFHGNTDPVFMALVLLSVYLLTVRESYFLSGVVYGISLSIKIVPVILVPLFFFWLKGKSQRLKFFSAAALLLVAGYGYHSYQDFFLIKRNIFDYESTSGLWGMTPVLDLLGMPSKYYVKVLKYMMLASIAWKAWDMNRGKGQDPVILLQGLAWSFLIFLFWSPGFGIQYLVWLAAPMLFWGKKEYTRYFVLSGVFAFSVYNNWCNGFPWYYAGAAIWNPWEWLLLYVIWSDIARWLYRAQFLKERAIA